MVKKELCFLLYILLAFQGVIAQNNSTDFNVGKTFKLNSVILNQERDIQIYLPEDYHESKEKCPVIYVFDSQKYFLNAVSYQQNLRFQEETPGFIVVGIKTKNNERRLLYNNESLKFSDYLEKELIPFIDSKYRTLTIERVFFGWQRAGAFGIELLASKPNLFKGYFIASPTFLSTKRVSKLGNLIDNSSKLNNYLYFSLGDVESWSLDNTNSLAKLLEEKAKNKLKWQYDLFKNENHYSTTIVTMNKGLKVFFKDYAPIRYYSINQFKKDGSIKGLRQLFKIRGKRYGISTDIHNKTKRYLFLLAVKENNFDVFIELDNEFPSFLASFSRDIMFERFGQFYVKHKAYKKAISYYKIGLQKFPESLRLQKRVKEILKLLKK